MTHRTSPLPGAPAPQAAPAAPARTITRAQLLDMGRTQPPLSFLAMSAPVLRTRPDDAELRFVFAAALGRAGLGTLALEQLRRLPATVQEHADVGGLIAALGALPDDRIDPRDALARLEHNMVALAQRGIELPAPDMLSWRQRAAARQWFRTLDGTMVLRDAGDAEPTNWVGLNDVKSTARSHAPQALGKAEDYPPGVYLSGVCPPWFALELWSQTRPASPSPTMYSRPIVIVEPSVGSLLDALSMADLSPMLLDPRVTVFAGPSAHDALRAWMRSRMGCRLRAAIVSNPIPGAGAGARDPIELGRVVLEEVKAQSELSERMKAQVAQRGVGRDRDYWRARYATALSGQAAPLRVLIPTCRYSTFVRHSAEDLARTLRRHGCQTSVLIEPDSSSVLSSVAYLRAALDFDPDLIVRINYPRSKSRDSLPDDVPLVCWIQDAMPHLFDPKAGADFGPLDGVIGHLYDDLFTACGYPRERSASIPVVADAHKFHPAPITAAQRDRHACEIALVSHHAETPQQLYTRLTAPVTDPAMRRAFGALYERCQTISRDLMSEPVERRVREALRQTMLEHLGISDESSPRAQVLKRSVALPLVDRFMRHQTIEWAAELCERRNWRLALYGNGWDRHPRFARYARGAAEHGEDLRACYQAAACHLHVSIYTHRHQRVAECAMSGGVPLARIRRDDLLHLRNAAWRRMVLSQQPFASLRIGRMLAYRAADCPEVVAFGDQLRRLGLGHEHGDIEAIPAALDAFLRDGSSINADVLGHTNDPASCVFHDPATLEALVDQMVSDPARRAAVSESMRERVTRTMSTDTLTHTLFGLMRRTLGC